MLSVLWYTAFLLGPPQSTTPSEYKIVLIIARATRLWLIFTWYTWLKSARRGRAIGALYSTSRSLLTQKLSNDEYFFHKKFIAYNNYDIDTNLTLNDIKSLTNLTLTWHFTYFCCWIWRNLCVGETERPINSISRCFLLFFIFVNLTLYLTLNFHFLTTWHSYDECFFHEKLSHPSNLLIQVLYHFSG